MFLIHFGWMESDLLNGTESISSIAFWPYESDLLKDAEIFTALESHLLNGAESFLLWLFGLGNLILVRLGLLIDFLELLWNISD